MPCSCGAADTVSRPTPAWLAIAGPTASGKTALALALAHEWPIEIISVDSALVFRGMDIGTAKPTAAELAQVPHHLIDIRDPTQAYSAAEFVRDAQSLLPAIQARGHLPVLVGGTMLYFKALFEGLDDLPPAQPAWREQIETRAQNQGWPVLHAELAHIDPVTAARLAPQDGQRIGRALEVWHATGRPLSSFHTRNQKLDPQATLQVAGQPGCLLSLEPVQRAWLHERIALRFETMLEDGLLAEVQALRQRGDLSLELPSMRCVGYRQTWEALEKTATLDAAAWAEWRDRGIFATRQLAKRQLTWLRSMPQRHVVACDQPDALPQALGWIRTRLTRP